MAWGGGGTSPLFLGSRGGWLCKALAGAAVAGTSGTRRKPASSEHSRAGGAGWRLSPPALPAVPHVLAPGQAEREDAPGPRAQTLAPGSWRVSHPLPAWPGPLAAGTAPGDARPLLLGGDLWSPSCPRRTLVRGQVVSLDSGLGEPRARCRDPPPRRRPFALEAVLSGEDFNVTRQCFHCFPARVPGAYSWLCEYIFFSKKQAFVPSMRNMGPDPLRPEVAAGAFL